MERAAIEDVLGLVLPKRAKYGNNAQLRRKSFGGTDANMSPPRRFVVKTLEHIPSSNKKGSPKKKIEDYFEVAPSIEVGNPSTRDVTEFIPVPKNPDYQISVVDNSVVKVVEPIVISMKKAMPTVVLKKPKKSTASRSRKRKASKEPSVLPEEYEVEKVIGHRKNGDKVDYYQIKWKNWSDEHNTWEPLDNLRTSLAAIADYYQERVYPGRGEIILRSHVENLREQLTGLDDKIVAELCFKYLTEAGHSITIDEAVVEENLVVLSRIPPFARDSKMVEDVRRQLQLVQFRRKREEQLELLRTWESEINAISNDPAPVKIYNVVDLEPIPKNFIFVNGNVPDYDVVIPDNNPLACECKGSCLKNSHCCWNGSLHNEPPYTKDGLLRYDRGTPIYECNKNCKCGPTCGNRILQRGRTIPMSIFKTNNGCGWGVRTLEPIKKGAFVVEYVGEVIKTEIAEIRGKTYDKVGCTYLFDLDFDSEDDCPYTIDAAIYGNVSHFINHSCEPNLTIFAVWVDCMDSHLPRLGLYANRHIKAFEELSFDYMMEKPYPKTLKKDEGKQTYCRCNAKTCRKLVF